MFKTLINFHKSYLAKAYSEDASLNAGEPLSPPVSPNGEASAVPINLRAIQEAALVRADQIGTPNKKLEEWKYTRLNFFKSQAFRPIIAPKQVTDETLEKAKKYLQQHRLAEEPGRIVFLNGMLNWNLSDKKVQKFAGLNIKVFDVAQWSKELTSLDKKAQTEESNPAERSKAGRGVTNFGQQILDIYRVKKVVDSGPHDGSKNVLQQLNLAFLDQVRVIELNKKCQLPVAIHLIHLNLSNEGMVGGDDANGGEMTAMHSVNQLILLAEQSGLKLQETFLGNDENRWSNINTHVILASDANLNFNQLQELNRAQGFTYYMKAEIARSASLNFFEASLGGAFSRVQVDVDLMAAGANCFLKGVYNTCESQMNDHRLCVTHLAENTTSSLFYKGMLSDKSKSVYNGKVFISKEAQKSNSKHLNSNLLLSDMAEIDTKPELEIFADDVKATHGATVGNLSFEELFYLESRGLDPSLARELLEQAFLSEVVYAGVSDGRRRGQIMNSMSKR